MINFLKILVNNFFSIFLKPKPKPKIKFIVNVKFHQISNEDKPNIYSKRL